MQKNKILFNFIHSYASCMRLQQQQKTDKIIDRKSIYFEF